MSRNVFFFGFVRKLAIWAEEDRYSDGLFARSIIVFAERDGCVELVRKMCVIIYFGLGTKSFVVCVFKVFKN